MNLFFEILIIFPILIIFIFIFSEITLNNIKLFKLFTFFLFLFFFFFACNLCIIIIDNSYFNFFTIPYIIINNNINLLQIYSQKLFIIDGISFVFIFLSIFIIFLCYLSLLETIFFKIKYFTIILLLIFIFLNFVFLASDIFLFYIFFELLLIPMYFIISIWGTRSRKIKASYYFFFYTFLGSLFLLLGLILLLNIYGTTNIFYLLIIENNIINKIEINFTIKLFIWFCLFLPFFIKIPMFPMHIWLLEAHVEAPTIGSVILAALYLKLGGYGIIRFLLPIYSLQFYLFLPYIQCLALLGFIYTSFAAIRQLDVKKIIAYSSVAHMNLAIIGLFSINFEGILGSLYLMLSHGLTSAAMFFSAGVLYFRYQTRISLYFGGLVQIMPLFTFFTFLTFLANFGLPGFSSFIGELLIFLGIININLIVFFFSIFGVFFCIIFTLLLFTRLFFGPLNYIYIFGFLDLSKNEFYIFFFLTALNIFFGLSTDLLFQLIETNILFILEKFYFF